jgi:hypothetical protein
VQRYAVLSDLDAPDLRRVGLVVERGDRVRLLLLTDQGLRSEFRDAYYVTEPDGAEVVYQPGMPEYFDYVLLTLSRTFLVTAVEPLPEKVDSLALQRLFLDEVWSKQPRAGAREYPRRPRNPIFPTPRITVPDGGLGSSTPRRSRGVIHTPA